MKQQIFALVDCNNFYVSCERLFNPKLAHRPVVVLSNNDGCIIARSNEAKALGISMGTPYFKAKNFLKRRRVKVFSSNYPLYGDLSWRVMFTLQQLEPEVETYSIDEAFLRLPPDSGLDLDLLARHIRATVKQHTGIPVSIGLGSTKTLAKIANRFAKKNPEYNGVLDLTSADPDPFLARCEITEVWGIGRRHGERLRERGVHTALDLAGRDDGWIRKQLTVTGLRTAMELRGISCISLEKEGKKKSISSSKSFGYQVEKLSELKEALATYITQAAVKLRLQQSATNCLQVYLTTNRFNKKRSFYAASETINLAEPTADTSILIKHGLAGLQKIHRPGLRYQKCGVVLSNLVPAENRQLHLFCKPGKSRDELMEAIDGINARWGRHTIQYAAAGLSKPWQHRQEKKSPAYTTKWRDLPVVKASWPDPGI